MSEKIGTVEILVTRIYPLDAKNLSKDRTEVIVSPGTYDLYMDHEARYWMMTGKVNLRGFHKIGDGMFMGVPFDKSSDIEVVFPSDRFGPRAWNDLMASPEWQEGDPRQRLRLSLAKVPHD